MNIGIFSGTFDPVHEGHVLFALTACDQFGLDRVIFLPERTPRRKTPVATYEQRVAMLTLALNDYPHLQVLESSSDTHTASETLDELAEQFESAKPTLLMGADVFEFVPSWTDESSLDELLGRVEFIVALRTEDDGEVVIPLADSIDADAQFVPAPVAGVSSSIIRSGKRRYLDDAVLEYIESNQLYS